MTLKLVSLRGHDARTHAGFPARAAHRVCGMHHATRRHHTILCSPKEAPAQVLYAGPWIKEQKPNARSPAPAAAAPAIETQPQPKQRQGKAREGGIREGGRGQGDDPGPAADQLSRTIGLFSMTRGLRHMLVHWLHITRRAAPPTGRPHKREGGVRRQSRA